MRTGCSAQMFAPPKHGARSVADVDLNTVAEVVSPAGVHDWRPGDSWLAGGTGLFAEPGPGVTRLLDLATSGCPALTVRDDGLYIAATFTVTEVACIAC